MNPERWKQVSQLFHAALARDAGERATFLTRECAGDYELRLIVESLISHQATAEKLLEGPAFAILAKPDPEGRTNDPNQTSADQVSVGVQRAPGRMEGRRLGAYRIMREIGHGGMGSVYLAARDDDVFHKKVAIKIMPTGLANVDLFRRFHQEREILASLDHPAIARVIDGGSTEEGLPYLVMDYVDGRPIDAWCDEHRLKLFRAVCAAVQHAHQRFVLHRDIKPAHILVTLNGDVKLLDFGIAKLFADDGLARTQLETETATRIMTPEYASPEQVRGDAVHTASDVYALGVVLYELLTGRWPYGTRSRRPYDVIRAICDEEPTRPSIAVSQKEEAPRAIVAEGGVDALRRRLEGDLDNILLKALQKDPTRRYASAEQFNEDIRRHLEGFPVSARKDTVAYRAHKYVRRHRIGVAAAAIILMSLFLIVITTFWELQESRQISTRALVLFNYVFVVVLGVAVYVTRPGIRRFTGALCGGLAVAFFMLSRADMASLAPLTAYSTSVAAGTMITLIGWRVTRRFGWRGQMAFIVILSIFIPLRARAYGMAFDIFAVAPGFQHFIADAARWAFGIAVSQLMMRLVAGPAGKDRLARVQRNKDQGHPASF
jgi:eukaryotic-like serine/threonine-protein kinase